ncbi:MAG: universal stress protein [Verrucomicrobiota bacterium]|nr:universal stress protein [Verrucomicrobiota bacterium]
MPAPPYRTIAVASAFSPRFEQVLAEAKRARDRLGVDLNLIFVGKKNAETTRRFSEALVALKLPADSRIHYHQGSPAEAILEAVRANAVQLLVAGALEKEVIHRSFLGDVARRLVREAPCSVLLFTTPEREPTPLRRIVFFVPDYSAHARSALKIALHLALQEECEKLYVIRVYTTFDAARAQLRAKAAKSAKTANANAPRPAAAARTLEEEEAALDEFIIAAGETRVPIEARCIRGNTGFAASNFVQAVEANLLVVPVAPGSGRSELPAHIAWVTDVIPCNLWVIR